MSIRRIVAGIVLMAAAPGWPNGPAVASPPPPCGRTWTIVPSPNADPEHNALRAVSAVSSESAWAVGGAFDRARGEFSTLIERWDGNSWSIVPARTWGASATS
jgi:hypothetical protein